MELQTCGKVSSIRNVVHAGYSEFLAVTHKLYTLRNKNDVIMAFGL